MMMYIKIVLVFELACQIREKCYDNDFTLIVAPKSTHARANMNSVGLHLNRPNTYVLALSGTHAHTHSINECDYFGRHFEYICYFKYFIALSVNQSYLSLLSSLNLHFRC